MKHSISGTSGGRIAATSSRVEKLLRARGWNLGHGTVKNRVWSLAYDNHPWWDWGHKVMIVVGSDFGGNWDSPKPPTWWYRDAPSGLMWRTKYPRRRYEIVTTYDAYRLMTKGVNEDEKERWKAIGTNQDGDITLGRMFWGGRFYGLDYAETRLMLRYLARWHLANWFGARSWLYSQALHAAVYRRKPGACNQPPPKGAGGYQHWLCEEKRGHDGFHRHGAHVWGKVAGENIGVTHAPEVAKR